MAATVQAVDLLRGIPASPRACQALGSSSLARVSGVAIADEVVELLVIICRDA